jgi:hypothetical protein
MDPSSTNSWQNAKSACEGMGMKLASLKTAEINNAAIEFISIILQNAGYVL